MDGDGDVDIVDVMQEASRWDISCENPNRFSSPPTRWGLCLTAAQAPFVAYLCKRHY